MRLSIPTLICRADLAIRDPGYRLIRRLAATTPARANSTNNRMEGIISNDLYLNGIFAVLK
jgi:hypothetical protein